MLEVPVVALDAAQLQPLLVHDGAGHFDGHLQAGGAGPLLAHVVLDQAAEGDRFAPGGGPESGMRLTKAGKRFLERYQKFRSGLDEAARRQFDRAFGA